MLWKVATIKIGRKARLGFHLSDNAGLTEVPVAPYGDSGSLTRFQRFCTQSSKKSSLWLVGFGTYFPSSRSPRLWVPSEGPSDSPLLPGPPCSCCSPRSAPPAPTPPTPQRHHQNTQHWPGSVPYTPGPFILSCM